MIHGRHGARARVSGSRRYSKECLLLSSRSISNLWYIMKQCHASICGAVFPVGAFGGPGAGGGGVTHSAPPHLPRWLNGSDRGSGTAAAVILSLSHIKRLRPDNTVSVNNYPPTPTPHRQIVIQF